MSGDPRPSPRPGGSDSPKREMELVERALRGDGAAFEHLIADVEPALRSFLGARLSSRRDVALDEALQETRIYLYRRLDRYNPAYPFAVFARALAGNVAKRFLFRRSDVASYPAGDDPEEDIGTKDLSPMELERLPLGLRQVLGEGRFTDPGAAPAPSRTFLELFQVFLRFGGYPHQQVAFGYSVLLWGKTKKEPRARGRGGDQAGPSPREKVPVTGDPDRVVVEVGPLELRTGSDGMLSEIGDSAGLEPSFVHRVREPLDFRLGLSVSALFARDPVSRKQFERISGQITSETRLRDYFGRDERKSVGDWTHTVKERIKKAILEPGSRDRSPLPMPDPTGTPALGA